MKTFTFAPSMFVRVITFGLVLSALSLTAEAQQGTGRAVSPKSQAQVQALLKQADAASRQGQNEKALNYYQKAIPLAKAAGDKSKQATILNNIGLVYSNTGEPQKALSHYQQALSIEKAVGDKAGEATTLSNIGATYSDIGEPQKALDYYQQALPIRKAVGDKAGEADTLDGIGLYYLNISQPQKALDYYQQALSIKKAAGDKAGEATILSNIGATYSDTGEPQKALDYYQQALPLAKAAGDKAQQATTLNNIGATYSDTGEPQKALDYYQRALPLAKAAGDKAREVAILSSIDAITKAASKPSSQTDTSQNPVASPIANTPQVSEQDQKRFAAIVQGVMGDSSYMTPKIRAEFWTLIGKNHLSPTDVQNLRQSLPLSNLYGRAFWRDALSSFKTGHPVKSDQRKMYESRLTEVISPDAAQRRIIKDDAMIAMIATHQPVDIHGTSVIVNESMIQSVLSGANAVFVRLDKLFTRP